MAKYTLDAKAAMQDQGPMCFVRVTDGTGADVTGLKATNFRVYLVPVLAGPSSVSPGLMNIKVPSSQFLEVDVQKAPGLYSFQATLSIPSTLSPGIWHLLVTALKSGSEGKALIQAFKLT